MLLPSIARPVAARGLLMFRLMVSAQITQQLLSFRGCRLDLGSAWEALMPPVCRSPLGYRHRAGALVVAVLGS